MNVLEQFGIIPVSSGALISLLRNYSSPNDKISNLEKKGDLIRLKKGFYVVSPDVHRQALSVELIANHLYGPSYISFERALSFYKLIPERVYATRSMTIKRARSFMTPLGNFDYVSAKVDYYSIGINSKIINDKLAYLVASPEKAICDMLVATPGLRLQSVKAMQVYLEENLRIDFSAIEAYNMEVIRQCLEVGKKKTELSQLYKFLQQ